jgi:hypothetical protein
MYTIVEPRNSDLFSAYECEYTRTHEHVNSKLSIYISFGDNQCHNNYKLSEHC